MNRQQHFERLAAMAFRFFVGGGITTERFIGRAVVPGSGNQRGFEMQRPIRRRGNYRRQLRFELILQRRTLVRRQFMVHQPFGQPHQAGTRDLGIRSIQ